MTKLKGGLGSDYTNTRKTRTKDLTPKAVRAAREALEARFDIEALYESLALRQHRDLHPARLLSHGRAT